MSRAAFIIGHDRVAKGAKMIEPYGAYEYDFNTEIALLCVKLNQGNPRMYAESFDRNDGLANCYERVNRWLGESDSGCAIELHFNSFTDVKVFGTETLYLDDDAKVLAQLIHAEILKVFGHRTRHEWNISSNRKVKKLADRARGQYNLSLAKFPAIIVEPFFGSNPGDAKWAMDHKTEYAQALVNGVDAYLRIY